MVAPLVQAPAWSKTLPGMGNDHMGALQAQALGDTVIVHGYSQVAALDRENGEVRWAHGIEFGDVAWVGDDAVVVVQLQIGYYDEEDAGGGVARGAVVLDARTGKERFAVQAGAAPLRWVAVTNDSLVVHRCDAGPGGPSGESCRVTVVDLGTGKQRWSRPVQRQYGIVPPGLTGAVPERRTRMRLGRASGREGGWVDPMRAQPAQHLIIQSAPDAQSRNASTAVTNTVVDIHTGQQVSTWQGTASRPGTAAVIGDAYLRWDGCPGEVTADDARTGQRRWSRGLGNRAPIPRVPWATKIWKHDSQCLGQPLLLEDGMVVHRSAWSHSQLIDGRTGDPVWRAPFAGPLVEADQGIAVLLRDTGEEPFGARVEMVAVDIASGKERWRRLPAPQTFLEFGGFAAAGGRIAFDGRALDEDGEIGFPELRVADMRTGRQLWRAPGAELIGMGDGWLAARFPTFGWGADGKPATIKYFHL